jgi:hypothetical protein
MVAFSRSEGLEELQEITIFQASEQLHLKLVYSTHTEDRSAGKKKWMLSKERYPILSSLFTIPLDQAITSFIAGNFGWERSDQVHIQFKYAEGIHGEDWHCTFIDKEIHIQILKSVETLQGQHNEGHSWKGHLIS